MFDSVCSSVFGSFFSDKCGSIFPWIGEKANYLCCLKDNVEALDKAWAELSALEKDVMTKVQNAEGNPNMPMQRKEVVKLWLQRVEDVKKNVDELEKVRSEEIGKLCLGGCCSKNFKSSYQFGKKVANLKKTVTTLKDGGNFKEDVAERAPPPPAIMLASEKIMASQGQQSTLDQVWGCLIGEPAVEIISLYGPGGVGKTTLLKQINNKLSEESNGFQVIIWVVVSQKPNVEKIQEKIGKRIGFSDESWKKRSNEEKAQDITNALAKKKFALLLDDVWNWIDLTQVGVPLQSIKSSGSKIVFTTRKHDVCDSMKSKKFAVKCLADKEAWELFQEMVGKDTLQDLSILEQARILYKECDGLPLALVVIGRAMTSKTARQEWELAIQDLKTLSSEFPGMEDKVYSSLKYSYNNLSKDTIRSCFLYCSLFPEDYNISKTNLLDCWVGEGLVDVYDRGFSIIGELVRACLLEEEDDQKDDYVKMHDVIRDMALWIAKEEQKNFLVEAGVGLTEFPKVEKWERIKRLSLMQNKIKSVPAAVAKCPDLITLFINNNHLEEINDDFFLSMSSLKVLDLSNNIHPLWKLPLGVLYLAPVLQHLDVSFTLIKELPEALRAMVNLKCLKAEHTSSLCTVPKQVISGFKKLQVLRILAYDISNLALKDSVLYGGSELLVEELFELKQLNALSLTIKNSHAFQKILSPNNLKSCIQYLGLSHFTEITLSLSFMEDMKNLEKFYICSCRALEFMEINCAYKINIGTHGFHNIQFVAISCCLVLRDLTWLVLAPKLKSVWISSCENMEEIISVENLSEVQKIGGNLNPFEKLQFLELRHMPCLQSIYPYVWSFPHLKELRVHRCPKLTKLPLDSNSAKNGQIQIYGDQDWWEELQWEDEATKKAFLPSYQAQTW